jgi:hypothetical protein
MTGATPGQAAYEAFRSAVPDWVCNVPAGPWDELSPAVQAGFDAIAAQEPHAAEVEAAFAGGMRVRTGPCTVEAHDREHFQVRTNGHWLCGHLLASVLAVQGIVADARPQPAPELAAYEADIASLTDQRNRVSETADQLRTRVRNLRDALERCRDAAGRSPAAVHTIASQALASSPLPGGDL